MKIAPVCTQNILKLARAYAAHEGIKLQTVARYFHGSSHIFEALEAGEVTLTLVKYDQMMDRFRKQWPEGLAWPKIREPFHAGRR